MIQSLHPQVHREPGWWADEELVVIAVDIELAHICHERQSHRSRIQRVEIDTWESLLAAETLAWRVNDWILLTEDDGNVDEEEDEIDEVAFAVEDRHCESPI